MSKIAQGIMIDNEYKDGVSYTIACSCSDPDHQVHMWIEVDGDAECNDITLTFYVNTTTPFWKKGFSRLKAAWDILVKGYREDQHSLIFKRDSALNVVLAIKETVVKLDKLRESL